MDLIKASEELGNHILKFETLNAFPVPIEADELSAVEALRASLFSHSAKPYKTY